MKHVVITGAASGIGWALAKQYWQQGAHVHLIDVDKRGLQTCEIELETRVTCYPVNLLDEQEVEDLIKTLSAADIRIHRLINNAGITHRSLASQTEQAVFKRVMALNWQVPVALSQGLLSIMDEQGAKIINIASMAALMPVPGRAAYCASKSALNQHFETWRPELLARGIELLMVFPSFVATNIETNALDQKGQPASHAQSTIGKQIGPDNMARLIVKADEQNKQRYLSNSIAPRIGYWLWFLLPGLFQRISWRKFAGDLS